ncbi:MAG TPA: FTR1 family protein [Vicinamibacteria bacterium]|nr:FTR1 family protein [Vicinamibacteria bacterium]
MKSIFKIRIGLAAVMAAAVFAGGCRRDPGALVPAPPDGGDAQRLVTILDYVSSDYARAVHGRTVVSADEYDEQVKFVSDAHALVTALLPSAPGTNDPLVTAVGRVETAVRAKAEPAEVARACRDAKAEAVARFGLRTVPTETPSLDRARTLYAQSCLPCHGAAGDARTEQAARLDPRPASFREPARLAALSPYRVYNTLTFGVPGTAMASFESLSPSDRWALAFYVLRLGHEGEPARGPARLSLADQAVRTDPEIADALRASGVEDPQRALVHLRTEAAFQEPPATLALERTRDMLRAALVSFEEGRAHEADRRVMDAYLEGFEPLEPRLRARDAEATAAVEAGFRDLRVALQQGDGRAVRATEHDLERVLDSLARGHRPAVPMLAAFLIYFREGVEAALLVGALLAGVRRLGRADAVRYVHAGWLAALPAGVLTWWLSSRVLAVRAADRELSEALIALLAAAVLFSMSFWMISKVESRRWTGYLRKGLEASLTRRNLALLAGLSFLAVYREAAETVLFTQALLLEAPGRPGEVWGGAAAGLLAVLMLATLMNRTVVRLPLGLFFAVSSALMCALAISFAGAGIYELVAAGYLRPRPVPFPEVPWMGIHPDLTALAVQLTIVTVIAVAAVVTLRRPPEAAPAPAHPPQT